MNAAHYEVVIVGGGPAGAALAWLLGREGRRVLLVDDGAHRGGAPRESLLPSSRPGLEQSGLMDVLRAAAAPDPCRHGAIWGEAKLTWRADPEPGLILDRGRFDAALQAAAVAAGAEVRQLRWSAAAAAGVTADHLVVATGRRATSQVAVETLHRGVETFALTLRGELPEAARLALVEAVPEGWWWWIGDGATGGTATLIGDAGELASRGTRRLLATAREHALGPVRELVEARICRATRATSRLLGTTTEDALLIGDAAATIDPLASQGVEKALAAAEHAAAVLRTAAVNPAWWPRLRAAHAAWERELYHVHDATAATFLSRERRFANEPFWSRRHRSAPATPSSLRPDEPLRADGDLQECAVLERFGEAFREVIGVRHRRSGDSLGHIGYVPVAPVLRAFATPCTLAAAAAAFAAEPRLYVLPPAAVQAAAGALAARGWLSRAATESP